MTETKQITSPASFIRKNIRNIFLVVFCVLVTWGVAIGGTKQTQSYENLPLEDQIKISQIEVEILKHEVSIKDLNDEKLKIILGKNYSEEVKKK